jgi:hypothetical protein
VIIRGVLYRPVWSFATGDWDYVDDAGNSIDDVVRTPTFEQLQDWMAAKAAVDLAVERLIAEQGPRLAELQKEIDETRHGWAYEFAPDAIERQNRHRKLEDERDAIIARYDPAKQMRGPQSFAVPVPVPLPVSTSVAEIQGPQELTPELLDPYQNAPYAPDIEPEHGVPLGTYTGIAWTHEAVRASVGDAYAYNLPTDMLQVGNDLERLARAGYTEIHIATGTHGSAVGGLTAEIRFLQEDQHSISETMQRHPGLRIVPYDMGDPVQVASFEQMQALAAETRLPGGATLAAFCYSRTRVPDPDMPSPGPIGTVEVLQPAAGAFLSGGMSAAFGVLSVYGGLHDPDQFGATLKVTGGAAQVVGGTTYVVGSMLESVPVTRFGSVLGEFGGYVGIAATLYDLYRTFDSAQLGSRTDSYEALTTGFERTLQLAGLMFPEAALAAVAFHYGFEPMAEKGAEIAAPVFVGGVSQAYGIPDWMVWGMHGQ